MWSFQLQTLFTVNKDFIIIINNSWILFYFQLDEACLFFRIQTTFFSGSSGTIRTNQKRQTVNVQHVDMKEEQAAGYTSVCLSVRLSGSVCQLLSSNTRSSTKYFIQHANVWWTVVLSVSILSTALSVGWSLFVFQDSNTFFLDLLEHWERIRKDKP